MNLIISLDEFTLIMLLDELMINNYPGKANGIISLAQGNALCRIKTHFIRLKAFKLIHSWHNL